MNERAVHGFGCRIEQEMGAETQLSSIYDFKFEDYYGPTGFLGCGIAQNYWNGMGLHTHCYIPL